LNIGIIGVGVVGSATAQAFNKFGHHVVLYDIDNAKWKWFYGKKNYTATQDPTQLVEMSDVVFICVNTPTNADGSQDITQVRSAMGSIVDGIKKSKTFTTVILRSTVLPMTNDSLLSSMKSLLGKNKNWQYFYNPEFLREDHADEDMLNPDRIIIGGDINNKWRIIETLFEEMYKGKAIMRTGLTEAEMIKYGANCFLATKISYFNELGKISKALGLNVGEIEHGIALDKRIGEYGTHSGKPFGGKCLPKDALAFCKAFEPKILSKVIEVNDLTR